MFLPWWEWSLLDSVFGVQRSQNCLMNMKLTNDHIIKQLNTPGRLRASVLDRPHPRSSKKQMKEKIFWKDGVSSFSSIQESRCQDALKQFLWHVVSWHLTTETLYVVFPLICQCKSLWDFGSSLCHIALLNIPQHLDFHTVINCLNQGLEKTFYSWQSRGI